jgi:hypothetical protein
VLALDVSDEMLRLGQANLAGVGNLQWVLGSGADLDVIGDCWVDDVFSSITLQHVPSPAIVLRYLQEANRVLRRGGQAALQMRHPGPLPWAVDLAGHLGACRAGPPGLVGGLARDPPPGAPTAPGSLHVRGPASSYHRVAIGTCGCCSGADPRPEHQPLMDQSGREAHVGCAGCGLARVQGRGWVGWFRGQGPGAVDEAAQVMP